MFKPDKEKVYAVNYFRLASSTWITVMGFDTWRRIKHPRMHTKRQMWIRFLCYSLYAWTIPLILAITAQIYWNIHFKGSLPACWLGGKAGVIVLRLTNTPNIILVTGNLFFFIPSAITVYQSRKMVSNMSVRQNSPTTLKSIERKRIQAIFRLFILTEFYTFPRLIHLVSDVSTASPYPLMISVWLYQLLGPCVFFGFICKSDVLEMLKSSVKQRTIRPLQSLRIPRVWSMKSYSFSSSSQKTSSTPDIEQSSSDVKGQINLTYEE